MKNLMLSLMLLVSSSVAFAEPTILTGKKIECQEELDGPVTAWFVLDGTDRNSNETVGVLKTFGIRYWIDTWKGTVSSNAKVEKVSRPYVTSVSAISYDKFDFALKGDSTFTIVIESSYVGSDYFKIETNLNLTGSHAPAMRFRSDGPKVFPYCVQTNENI